eukprot:scaffold30928_cov30-Cyclotella_meneghiniana.AAC.1
MDATSGYNQLRVALESQEKLAFAGPDATKWTWLVMPFGPLNGPAIFIMFMHDMAARYNEVARSRGIGVGQHANSRLIVDDFFNYCRTFMIAIAYLRAQLDVCRAQNLSLSLCENASGFLNVLSL